MNLNMLNRTISFFLKLLDTAHPTIPPYEIDDLAVRKPAPKKRTSSSPLPRTTPEAVGVPSDRVRAFLEVLREDPSLNMHSVILVRNGKVFCEASFGGQMPDVPKMIFSASKSVTSIAIGMLMDDGLLSPDDKLTDLFDQVLSPLQRLKLKQLTVKQLLNMTANSTFNEAGAMIEKNWIRSFFSGLSGEGGAFRYNSLNSYILSVIVSKKSGMSLTAFLKKRLFDPLGIENVYWELSPEGYEKGGWGLYLLPEDMAKLGVFLMNKGKNGDCQLLSSEYLSQALSPTVPTPNTTGGGFSYGYHIWCKEKYKQFLCNGMFGQNVHGFAQNGIIVVSNAGNDEMFQQSRYYALAETFFCNDFSEMLPDNPQAYAALCATVDRLRLYFPPVINNKPEKKPSWWQRLFRRRKAEPEAHTHILPAKCTMLDGAEFEADGQRPLGLLPVVLQTVQSNNTRGFIGCAFFVRENRFYMEYREVKNQNTICINFDNTVQDCLLQFGSEVYRAVAYGIWATDEDENDVLKLRIDFCETPCSREIKLFFDRDGVMLQQTEHPGAPVIRSGIRDYLDGMQGTGQKLVLTALDKMDPDFLEFKLGCLFAPSIHMARKGSALKTDRIQNLTETENDFEKYDRN